MANWRDTIESVLNDIILKNNGLVTKSALKMNSLLGKINNIVKDGLTSATSTWSSTKLTNLFSGKVDKVAGKQLSDENYTTAEKNKLASLESSKFLGTYPSLSALETAHPTASEGNYADVDAVGEDAIRYIWDDTDSKWVAGGEGTALTAAQVKQLYESNADTNAFTDTNKSKLAGIEAGAEVNTVSPQDVSAVQQDADAAQAAATSAQAAADAAQADADAAQTTANSAQSAATNAQTDIDNYKNVAGPSINVPDWGQDLVDNLNF